MYQKYDAATCVKHNAGLITQIVSKSYNRMVTGFEERCKKRYC